MIIDSYTISSVKDIDLLSSFKRVQFTLNGHTSPSRRRICDSLNSLQNKSTDIYIHEDFIRTVPRYGLMTEEYQKEMVKELVDILAYSTTHTNIKGIIIHMDNPFSKEMIKFLEKNGVTESSLQEACKKFIISLMFRGYDGLSKLLWSLYSQFNAGPGSSSVQNLISAWNRYSVTKFTNDITNLLLNRGVLLASVCKIYLENTSHVHYTGKELPVTVVEGTVLANCIHSLQSPILGYCWDTEHSYAAGDYEMDEDLVNLRKLISVNPKILIHLNTIEEGVKRGSKRDRHSMTTIFDCSVYPKWFYLTLVEVLNKMNIPYIREVKSETMEKELGLLKNINESNPMSDIHWDA